MSGACATPAARPARLIALTMLYALAIVLLLLVMLAIDAPGQPNGTGGHAVSPGMFQIFLLVFLIGMVLGDPNLGMFGYIMLGGIALVMLPIVIAIVFTIWVGTRPSAPCRAVTLHFAYGSNMSRPHMRARCPGASALGTATLSGWRFVINPDGYGSIAPAARRHRSRRALAADARATSPRSMPTRTSPAVSTCGGCCRCCIDGKRAHGAGLHRAAARRGDAAPRLHRDRGRRGTRLGAAGALYSLADALVAVGLAARGRKTPERLG